MFAGTEQSNRFQEVEGLEGESEVGCCRPWKHVLLRVPRGEGEVASRCSDVQVFECLMLLEGT
jgi:hypothetical protein